MITDGRIPGLDLVRSVVLAFGKPSGERPAGSGEVFTRLAASLAVCPTAPDDERSDVGVARSGPDGEGTLSLASQAVNLRTNVMLSRELSAQAGRDLYRLAREGERIVLPVAHHWDRGVTDGLRGRRSPRSNARSAIGPRMK